MRLFDKPPKQNTPAVLASSGLTDDAHLASAAPEPSDPRILAEQVRQLFELGKAGTFTVFAALVLVWLPFAPYVAAWTILPPLFVQLCAQVSFNRLRMRYHEDKEATTSPEAWGDKYARLCLLSGSAWGLAAAMWLPEAPFPVQALFSLVIACLGLNTVLSRHAYPRAVIAYTATSVGPLIAVLIAIGSVEDIVTASLGLLLWAVLISGAQSLNKSARQTVSLRFVNKGLIDRLAEATVIAENKAQDAERAYAVARKAASSRRDFLAMVTHEIRSPLANLTGLADLLGATELNDTQADYARGMQQSSQLLNRLVDDLADLTEMEALSIKLRPVEMSPSQVVHTAVHLLRQEAAARHLTIEIDSLPGTPQTIHSDPARIQQALTNLISRTLRTLEKGGVIVRISPVDMGGATPSVRFSVSDTSAGMPPQDAARLFSRDNHDYDNDRPQANRRDVNLTICDRLVRLMGGRIGADSSVGGGFTAWFVLACTPARADEVRLSPPGSAHNDPFQPGPPRARQLLDLDRVYELEQELGSTRIADHLNEAIGAIADIQAALARACRTGDLGAVRAGAEALTVSAGAIGLTGLADTASALLMKEGHTPPQGELCEQADHLEAKFHSGASALRRAYPALAG